VEESKLKANHARAAELAVQQHKNGRRSEPEQIRVAASSGTASMMPNVQVNRSEWCRHDSGMGKSLLTKDEW